MMPIMNVIDLRRVDLNLLVVFQALMQEGSVTRAAVKLSLSQSAVSAALARLRQQFADPLFERSRAGMVPTARALAISARVAPTLSAIAEVMFEDDEFDPKRSTRVLHLSMSDDVELVLAPWLAQQKRLHRWGIQFSIRQTNSTLWRESVEQADNDLTIAMLAGQPGAAVQSEALFSGSYKCLYNPELLELSDPVTYEEYVSVDHARVSHDVQRGWVDDLFAARGHQRKTLCSISHFSGLSTLVKKAPVVATIPAHAAAALSAVAGLRVTEVPLPAPRFTISCAWHARTDGSPENTWLRGILSDFARSL